MMGETLQRSGQRDQPARTDMQTTVVLSGASGGIGVRVIPLLLQDHAAIGLYHTRRPELPPSERLSLVQLDITDAEDVKAFVATWEHALERVILVHGAVESIDGLAAQYREEDWDRTINVNLKGAFLLTKALLPLMIHARWGRIIHLSSFVGTNGVTGTVGYAASKTGLLGMSRVLAKEYARFDITSNVLQLGYFDAGLIDGLSAQHQRELLNRIPNHQLGRVENIAYAIKFLLHADYVNGAVIPIDGGL